MYHFSQGKLKHTFFYVVSLFLLNFIYKPYFMILYLKLILVWLLLIHQVIYQICLCGKLRLLGYYAVK